MTKSIHFKIYYKLRARKNFTNFSIDSEKAIKKPSQKFSNFFNAYLQAINGKSKRYDSLLEKQIKRIELKDETYLKSLIIYIHNNPLQHNFVEKLLTI